MVGMVVRRLALLVPLLLVVSLGITALIDVVPGDAAVTLAGGVDAPPGAIEAIRAELNLDDPFFTRYLEWLGNALQFDFGSSLVSGRVISTELADRLAVTLSLGLAALVFIIPLALLTGITGGLRPGGALDKWILFGTSLAIAMPSFWVGLLLVSFFAVDLGWVPPFGYEPFTEDPAAWLQSIVLPAISLGLFTAAVLSRQIRAGLADVMQTAYIRTAWAKGGRTVQVVGGHALKNSAMPAVTVLGLQISLLLGGAVIIEQIFRIPGLGSYLVEAITTQDIPVVQAVALVFVVINVLANLAVDVTYGFLNPKVRTS
jgi:peptide/nickel transport system permease protein